MFLLNFIIFLFVSNSEACNKLPNCDYIIFENQIKALKFDNKNIRDRLDVMQSLLDNQTEFLISVEIKIDAIQETLKALDGKLPDFDNNKPPVDENEVVTTEPGFIDNEDYLDNEDNENICPIDKFPTDCSQFNSRFCENNKCHIKNQLYGEESFYVSCDHFNDGGGWTVIQRRFNGMVDFYRNWSQYKKGFGNIDGEFFIGLDKLYALTNSLKPLELFILLQDFDGIFKYAKYDGFIVGNEKEKYKLKEVGEYSGNAGNSFSQHQGCYYTTKDRDNDMEEDFNCAVRREGAWWYKKCYWSNLNGKYYSDGKVPRGKTGVTWGSFKGYNYSLKFVQMMIRPKNTALLTL